MAEVGEVLLVRMVVMDVWVGKVECMIEEAEQEWGWDAMGGCYLQHAELRNTYHILRDDLCCKIASEDRILVLLVACTVERHALSLNQSIVELFPNFFVK